MNRVNSSIVAFLFVISSIVCFSQPVLLKSLDKAASVASGYGTNPLLYNGNLLFYNGVIIQNDKKNDVSYPKNSGLIITDGTVNNTSKLPLQGFNFTISGSNIFYLNVDSVTNIVSLNIYDGTTSTFLATIDTADNIEGKNNTYNSFTLVNNKLYFIASGSYTIYENNAYTEYSNTELWASDGTPTGTSVIRNIAGTDTTFDGLYNLNNILCFLDAYNGTIKNSFVRLWKTDGTTNGTNIVTKINGAIDSDNNTVYHNKLYFYIADSTYKYIWWRSDGTDTGTYAEPTLMSPSQGITGGSYIYSFTSDPSKLYCIDSTTLDTAYTIPICDTCVNFTFVTFQDIAFKNELFFSNTSRTTGVELWKTNGSAAGTSIVKDIWPGPSSGIANAYYKVVGNYLYFQANDGVHGNELWRTDGTAAGTQLVADFIPGAASSLATPVAELKGNLFVTAYDSDSILHIYVVDTSYVQPISSANSVSGIVKIIGVADDDNETTCCNTYAGNMVKDRNDNVYITGNYSAPTNYGLSFFNDNYVLNNINSKPYYLSPSPQDFIACYDSSMQLRWAKSIGGGYANSTPHVAIAPDNNLYLAGYFNSSFTFDSVTVSGYDNGSYLFKFDTAGKVIWAAAGTMEDGDVTAITIDYNSNIFVGGNYYGTDASWDTVNVSNSANKYANFIVKYNSNGQVLWAKSIESIWNRYTYGIPSSISSSLAGMTTDNYGNLYVLINEGARQDSGTCSTVDYQTYANSFQLVCISPEGTINWSKTYSNQYFVIASDIKITTLGELLIAGRFVGELNVDSYKIGSQSHPVKTTTGTVDCYYTTSFTARFTNSGECLFAKADNTLQTDAYEVIPQSNGNYYQIGIDYGDTSKVPSKYFLENLYTYDPHALTLFIKEYNYFGELIQEKKYKKLYNDGYDNSNPSMILDSKGNIIIYDNVPNGAFDTIAQPIYAVSSAFMLLRTKPSSLQKVTGASSTSSQSSDLVTIAPNPSADIFYVISNDSSFVNYSVQVTDEVGKEVATFTKTDNLDFYKIDFVAYSPGMYFLTIRNSNQKVVKKIVKY